MSFWKKTIEDRYCALATTITVSTCYEPKNIKAVLKYVTYLQDIFKIVGSKFFQLGYIVCKSSDCVPAKGWHLAKALESMSMRFERRYLCGCVPLI